MFSTHQGYKRQNYRHQLPVNIKLISLSKEMQCKFVLKNRNKRIVTFFVIFKRGGGGWMRAF